MVWLLSSFFVSFFYYFLIFLLLIIIFNFYFNNFILFSFFLSYFLPFILSRVDDRVLVVRRGVRPVPLRWDSRVQANGPPQTSKLHVVSNGKNLSEISISMPRPSSTQ